jgi:hypothetical protein
LLINDLTKMLLFLHLISSFVSLTPDGLLRKLLTLPLTFQFEI